MKQENGLFFDFGQRLRFLRMQRSLSQEELALTAGITPAYLGMVERGEKNPTLITIEKLCCALETKFPLCNWASDDLELSQFECDAFGMQTWQQSARKPT